jgi:hypothetical protein
MRGGRRRTEDGRRKAEGGGGESIKLRLEKEQQTDLHTSISLLTPLEKGKKSPH